MATNDLDMSALLGGGPDLSDLTAEIDLGEEMDMGALLADPLDIPDPLEDLEYTGDLADDSRAEWDEIKANFQKQDKQQKAQFAGLYDSRFYFSEVYKTADECERAMKIQARVLGFDYERAGFGYYRNGSQVMKRIEALAERLGIDISDI